MSSWSSCLSWCFLSVVLAVNTRQTSSAPDFSDYLHRILKNHTAHACDGETLSIRCPTRTSVAVLSAFYGRRVPSPYLCPHANPSITEENTDCTSTTAIQKVMSECQDRRECQIPVVSPVFGQDPCPETSKYIIVSYKCKPECLSPSALRRVSRKCHGRTNCSVLADAQGFGDPCFPGTKKHLRVSFTCVPRYLLEDVGHGNIDPFLLSDYTHGGWYTGPGVSRPQNIFTNSLEIFSQIQGLPETVALYFVSGICAGLFFLLCLFGLKSTLIRDLKDLASEIGDELKSSHRTHGGLIDDFDDDDASLRSSFRHLSRPYRTPDVFNPEMIMTVVMEDRKDEDKPEMPIGDIWTHINSSPYAMHKIKTSSA
ncbi:protein eva-1 homolog C-like isoform X3 [Cyprinus carpio]|uniref:Protein eva-1 homolog C-like isoform X3 n=1 Tax=Cyprinus carpio TaxID=7962 RepID=A0A9Q9V992_CYPCA|nr:protein eva-1 homolog C-like isoform X3 [Cyprinus carpio]